MAVANAANGSAAKASAGRRRMPKKQKGIVAWLFSTVARLATWAAILTILFRCPSTIEECDDASPLVCKPYFRARALVAPHVQPYYDQYAADYVEAAQPYYQAAKANVFDPAHHYAVHYAAPWVESGKEFAWAQWESNGQPRLVQAQTVARTQYDKSVAPHVAKASHALEPYYNLAYENAQVALDKAVLPAYEAAKPYVIRGYDVGYDFATGNVLPAVSWGWSRTNAFLDTAVWPQLRIVYVENVEPQLVRIGERLGRYNLRSRNKTSRASATTSQFRTESSQSSYVSKPAPQSASSESEQAHPTTEAGSTHPADEGTEHGRSPVEAPPQQEDETDKQRKVREMVTSDLESWQEKFAQQAEDGASAIEDSVDEIARNMISNNANATGRALVAQLQKTITSEVDTLKTTISSIVAADANAQQSDDAEEEVVKAIRSAGVSIKAKAQLIRGWREDYDAELQESVLSTADVHFQILEETRSLALQQIGMKWAWTDGITYKDWAKYHELKSTFTDWTEELKQLIVTHPTLLEAQEASAKVEDDGMSVAAEAARELVNLKEVAKWKMLAADSSDNFDLESLKVAIEAKEKAAREAEEAAERAAREAEEVAARAAQEAEELQARGEGDDASESHAEEAVNNGENEAAASDEDADDASPADQPEAAEEAAAEDATGDNDDADKSAGKADDRQTADADEDVADIPDVSEEDDSPKDAEDEQEPPGEPIVPNRRPQTKPTQAADSELHDDHPTSAATGPEHGYEEPDEDSNEADQDKPSEPQGHDSHTKGALFGAFAQEVPSRHPILDSDDDDDDDDDTNDGYYNRANAAAQDAYSRAVAAAEERYSMASSVVSVQMYGTPKPVHNNLLSSLSAAYNGAVSAAASRLDVATSRASKEMHRPPTPTATTKSNDMFARAEEAAGRRLREGKMWAEMQYQSALLAVGMSTATATPTSIPDRAKYNYYAALGVAHERYSKFLSAASSAWSSVSAEPTPTPTNVVGSASSLASAARASAVSAANAAGQAAESVYHMAAEEVIAAGEAVDESINSLLGSAQEQVLIAGSTLSDVWDTVIEELLAEMYGEVLPIGWEEHSVEEERAGGKAATTSKAPEVPQEAVAGLVSELLEGKEAPFTESVLSRLSAVYASATRNIENVASAASSAAASMGGSIAGRERHEKDEL